MSVPRPQSSYPRRDENLEYDPTQRSFQPVAIGTVEVPAHAQSQPVADGQGRSPTHTSMSLPRTGPSDMGDIVPIAYPSPPPFNGYSAGSEGGGYYVYYTQQPPDPPRQQDSFVVHNGMPMAKTSDAMYSSQPAVDPYYGQPYADGQQQYPDDHLEHSSQGYHNYWDNNKVHFWRPTRKGIGFHFTMAGVALIIFVITALLAFLTFFFFIGFFFAAVGVVVAVFFVFNLVSALVLSIIFICKGGCSKSREELDAEERGEGHSDNDDDSEQVERELENRDQAVEVVEHD